MARTFASTDVSVLYRYMGDSIKLCTLPKLPASVMGDGTLDRQELALRLRLDKALMQMIAFKSGIAEGPTKIVPGIQPDGTGYIYVEYSPSVEMNKNEKVREYVATQGRNKRLQNIAISYWSTDAKTRTHSDVMPVELAEQILSSIDALIAGYVSSAAQVARWNETVTQAQAAITALEALGMPVPNELRVKANASKPRTTAAPTAKK